MPGPASAGEPGSGSTGIRRRRTCSGTPISRLAFNEAPFRRMAFPGSRCRRGWKSSWLLPNWPTTGRPLLLWVGLRKILHREKLALAFGHGDADRIEFRIQKVGAVRRRIYPLRVDAGGAVAENVAQGPSAAS